MNVIPVPGTLDHRTIDGLLDQVALLGEERSLFDARRLRWIDPSGMVGLLTAGAVTAQKQGAIPRLLFIVILIIQVPMVGNYFATIAAIELDLIRCVLSVQVNR